MIDNPSPSVPCDTGTRKPRALQPALPLWDPRIEAIPDTPRSYWVWSETDPAVRYTTNLATPTTLICASCGHETYALVDDGICAACSFFDDGSRPFRQVAEEGQATHAAPLPEPIPLVRERRCPDCDRPSLDDTIYCTVSRFGRGYCAHRSARREEASI